MGCGVGARSTNYVAGEKEARKGAWRRGRTKIFTNLAVEDCKLEGCDGGPVGETEMVEH